MFNLYDMVKLKKDREDIGLKKGTIGAIIDVVNNGEVYSVEFVDDNEETIDDSLFTYFKPDELELLVV